MSKPTIDQILTSLMNEVIFGRAYLKIATGLKDADSVVLGPSRTFFGLMLEASLNMSQMFAAKLYDKTSGAITVKSLLDEAEHKAGTFNNGTSAQVLLAVKKSTSCIASIVDILKSVQKRRNEALAHLDPKTVIDPAGLEASAKVTISDLEKVFDETTAILNEILLLWADTFAYLEFIGADDFKNALEIIADAKHDSGRRVGGRISDATLPIPATSNPSPKQEWAVR